MFYQIDAFKRVGGRSIKDCANKVLTTLAERKVFEHFSRTGKAPSTKKALPVAIYNLVKFVLLHKHKYKEATIDQVNDY